MKESEDTQYLTPPNSPPTVKVTTPIVSKELEDGSVTNERLPSGLLTPPATPSRHSSPQVAEEQKPKPARKPLEITFLRSSLKINLNSGLCGGLTLKGLPCRWRTYDRSKHNEINSVISSMTCLTRYSPELFAKIEELIQLISCHHHDHGKARDTRVAEWTEVFPVEDEITKPVTSLENRIREILGIPNVHCANERCMENVGGRKVQNFSRTVDEIVKPEIYCDDDSLEEYLEVLGCTQYCDYHEKSLYRTGIASRKTSIVQLREEETPSSSTDDKASPDIKNPVSVVKEATPSLNNDKTNLTQPAQILLGANSTRAYSTSTKQDPTPWDPANFWPRTCDITPFNIIARGGQFGHRNSPIDLLKQVLLRPLATKEQIDGYVYLYEVDGNKGLVKIGFTARSIELRHSEWSFDCNRSPKHLYPRLSTAEKIPNALRVEALCHAELDNYRVRHYCTACLKQHIEWFEVPAAKAIAVIERWSKWMATSPYGSPHRSGQQYLDREEMEKTYDMRQFLSGY